MTAPFRRPLLTTLRVLLLAWSTVTGAIDEAALGEQIAGKVEVGEPIELTVGEESVMALLTEETQGDLQGGAILIHDTGANPDWPDVIRPLRETLPDTGWTTLSVQMPLGPATTPDERIALLDAARPRLDAALTLLAGRGIRTIVLIGHGLGAFMAADYLGDYKGSAIRGLIAVSLVDYSTTNQRLDAPAVLKQVRQPILDIYGSRDLPAVTELAKHRAEAVRKAVAERRPDNRGRSESARRKSGRVAYRQLAIVGADHYFTGRQTALVRRVRGWLKHHVTGSRINR